MSFGSAINKIPVVHYRQAKYYGLSSLYDGCMTVKLGNNGSILAQNAVIYSQCLQYQQNVPDSLKLEEMISRDA